MRRSELAHLIRAACHATGEREVLVMGSQAALATWGEAAVPAQVTLSNEADIAFFHDPWELKADTVMVYSGRTPSSTRSTACTPTVSPPARRSYPPPLQSWPSTTPAG